MKSLKTTTATLTDKFLFFNSVYSTAGEGNFHWLQISRRYDHLDNKQYELEYFENFLSSSNFEGLGVRELDPEEFLKIYSDLIPDYISRVLRRKEPPPIFTWQTHIHLTYKTDNDS